MLEGSLMLQRIESRSTCRLWQGLEKMVAFIQECESFCMTVVIVAVFVVTF